MSEQATTITREQARAAREAIRAFRAAEREAKAARKDRRAERAEEIARHREAEKTAQDQINAANNDADAIARKMGTIKGQIAVLSIELKQARVSRDKIGALLDAAYTNRRAARDALKTLRAEIRGDTAEEAHNG